MDSTFEDDVKKHPYKNLTSTYQAIEDFSLKKLFSISIPTDKIISGCTIVLSKSSKSETFDFELELPKSTNFRLDISTFKTFGLDDSITLEGIGDSRYLEEKAVTAVTSRLGQFDRITGSISNLNTCNPHSQVASCFRLVIPVDKMAPTTLIQSTSYTDGTVIYGYGLATISIGNAVYQLYRHENQKTNQNYLILDCTSTENFLTFKKTSRSIIRAFSIICGNWYGGQRFILSSENSSFDQIKSVHFFKESESIITNTEIIDSFGFVQYMKVIGGENLKISENSFPDITLSKIASDLLNHEELDRTLSLILEGNRTKSNILKSCTYFVAIETLASLISKKNEGFFSTIKKQEVFDELKERLSTLVEEFKENLEEQELKNILKKIEYLNAPSNMDKIIMSFRFYNLELPDFMLRLLKTRNVFLHGKTPFKEHQIKDKGYELLINSLRLHWLACTLFLKYFGYKGHIKNFAGYRLYQDNLNNIEYVIEDHIYYKI